MTYIIERNELYSSDYVIYNKNEDYVIRWKHDVGIVIYGDKDEAERDCRGDEKAISCTELPQKYKNELLNQINEQ